MLPTGRCPVRSHIPLVSLRGQSERVRADRSAPAGAETDVSAKGRTMTVLQRAEQTRARESSPRASDVLTPPASFRAGRQRAARRARRRRSVVSLRRMRPRFASRRPCIRSPSGWPAATGRDGAATPVHRQRLRVPSQAGAVEAAAACRVGWAAWNLHRSRCGYELRRRYQSLSTHLRSAVSQLRPTAGASRERR